MGWLFLVAFEQNIPHVLLDVERAREEQKTLA